MKHIISHRPDLAVPISQNVENMWLDESVEFDEEQVMEHLRGDDPQKRKNFKLTRIYDMLCKIMANKDSRAPMAQESVKLLLAYITREAKDGAVK